MKKQTFFLLTVTVVILLTGCFSSWNGGDGTITISFGGSSGRSVEPTDPDFWEKVSHNIELSGSTTRTIPVPVGAKSFHAEVKPGLLHITVTAIFDDKPYAKGSKSVVVYPGENTPVTIEMERIVPETGTGNVKILPWDDKAGKIFVNGKEVSAPITINQNTTPDSFTARYEGDANTEEIEWYLFGRLISKGNREIIILAENYFPGNYQLLVKVEIDDQPYSTEIEFTVAE